MSGTTQGIAKITRRKTTEVVNREHVMRTIRRQTWYESYNVYGFTIV